MYKAQTKWIASSTEYSQMCVYKRYTLLLLNTSAILRQPSTQCYAAIFIQHMHYSALLCIVCDRYNNIIMFGRVQYT